MRKWSILLLFVLEASAVLLAVYWEPTTSVRGTLRGEAFFKGRSTSYWRSAIDQFVTRYGSRGDALTAVAPFELEMGSDSRIIHIQLPKVSDRVRRFVTKENEFAYLEPPDILRGFADAEPVLQELESDVQYQDFVEAARKTAKQNQFLGPSK